MTVRADNFPCIRWADSSTAERLAYIQLVSGSNPDPPTMGVILGERELPKIAERLVAHISPGDIIVLFGPLAAGKTTLVRHVAAAIGYLGRVTSPTFVLERIYPVQFGAIREIAHLDFYRLSAEELSQVAWREFLGANHRLTIIEWPEIAIKNLPKTVKKVKIEIVDDQHRRYQFWNNFSH